jgi:hypothetical protein
MTMLSKVTDSKGAGGDIGKDEQNGPSVSKDWAGWARQRTILLVLLVSQTGYMPGFRMGCFALGGGIFIERFQAKS